jgi:uncharacterized membrane protein YgcG
LTATTQTDVMTPAPRHADHRPTSKDQLVKDRFLAWLRSLDPTSELGPFAARWLFAGLEHVLEPADVWDEFTTRKPKGPMAGTYWVQVLTGVAQVDDELLAQFDEDFAEEGTDYAVLVSAGEFTDRAAALYDKDSRVLLFGPDYFLRKFAGLLYHPDAWVLMLARALRDMERPELFSSLAEPQPVSQGQQPRGGRGGPGGGNKGGGGQGGGQGGQGGGGQRRRFIPKGKNRQPAGG